MIWNSGTQKYILDREMDMERLKKGKKVVIVSKGGVITGTVHYYEESRNSYIISTYYGILHNVKPSHVYPKDDYGRASQFFESRYL